MRPFRVGSGRTVTNSNVHEHLIIHCRLHHALFMFVFMYGGKLKCVLVKRMFYVKLKCQFVLVLYN